jgi:hypothetical protein
MQDLNAGTVADYFSSGNVQCGGIGSSTPTEEETRSLAPSPILSAGEIYSVVAPDSFGFSFFKLSYHGPVGLGVSEFDA